MRDVVLVLFPLALLAACGGGGGTVTPDASAPPPADAGAGVDAVPPPPPDAAVPDAPPSPDAAVAMFRGTFTPVVSHGESRSQGHILRSTVVAEPAGDLSGTSGKLRLGPR